MRKKGFTLIELLAVIVILATVALIATPIILGIISDAKENAFKSSIDGIVRSALTDTILNIKGEDILYKYNTNNWEVNKLDIDGQIPKYVEIKVNKEGQVRYAITDGEYCALKEYDSELNIKNIGSENNDKIIKEQYCKLTTDEACFEFNDTKTSVIAYNCYERNDKGKPVITDIVIPEGITLISTAAFRNKKLKSVVIPEGVTAIGMNAFKDSKLEKVTLPDSLKSIEYGAFNGCQLKNVIISNNVTSIDQFAFAYNQLTNIIIPDSVTHIGQGAFRSNLLANISLPNSITSFGDQVFTSNQLPDNQAFIYDRKSDGSIDYSSLNSYGGKRKDEVIIPEGVITIGTRAFFDTSLASVSLPNSLKSIEESAFYDNDLISVTIPNNVMEIGNHAFMNNRLTSVTIKGKSSTSDFTNFGFGVFTFAPGYNDSNIKWEPEV